MLCRVDYILSKTRMLFFSLKNKLEGESKGKTSPGFYIKILQISKVSSHIGSAQVKHR